MKVIKYSKGVAIRTEEAANKGITARYLNPKAYNKVVSDFVRDWGMKLSQRQSDGRCAMVGDFENGIYFHENDTNFKGAYAKETYYMDFLELMETEYETTLNE